MRGEGGGGRGGGVYAKYKFQRCILFPKVRPVHKDYYFSITRMQCNTLTLFHILKNLIGFVNI